MSGGLRFLQGGPPQGPDGLIVDEYYARQNKLHVGQTMKLLNHDWQVSGIVQGGMLGPVCVLAISRGNFYSAFAVPLVDHRAEHRCAAVRVSVQITVSVAQDLWYFDQSASVTGEKPGNEDCSEVGTRKSSHELCASFSDFAGFLRATGRFVSEKPMGGEKRPATTNRAARTAPPLLSRRGRCAPGAVDSSILSRSYPHERHGPYV
jgi:hypothetical protein